VETTKIKRIRLYTVEEDEIYLDLCSAVFQLKAPITLLGVLNSRDIGALKQVLVNLSPNVVLISIKDLGGDIKKELEQFRMDYPKIGIVLLLGVCNAQDIEKLRQLALFKGVGGTAILLKQPLDRMDWLCSAISAVSQGQLLLDASLTAHMFAGKPGYTFLKQFTPRELEILNMLANGYTNLSIAKALYIDIKTVEHHLNNMYGKLKENNEFVDKHLRVSVAKLYLDAISDSSEKKNLIVRS
jgi:DNA-binding NarL/FixJ family response regulator